MLKKDYRLRKKEFTRAFTKGKPFVFDFFIVKYISNKFNRARFGISVGVKLSKKAVIRNRLKRQLYRVIKTQLSLFPKGDYIIIARRIIEDGDALKTFFEKHIALLCEKISRLAP